MTMHRLLLSSALLPLALAGVAHAQVAEPVQNEVDTFEDEIVVTGSRTAIDPETTAANPVVALSNEELLRAGQVDISTALRETPSLQGSLPASFSALQGADTDDQDLGLGLLNLRSFGIERTLVLQNSRRHVPATAGQSAVDVNTISPLLIDRVDILTGGASSVYGADAVTGVVNFIMRDARSFDGIEGRLYGGISDRGDAEEFAIGAAYGKSFLDDRGQIVVSAEYDQSEPVFGSDRDFAGSGLFEFVPGDGNPFANTYVNDYRLPISSAGGVIAIADVDVDGFASAFFNVLDQIDGILPGPIGASGVPRLQYFDGTTLREYNPGNPAIDGFNASGGDGVPANPDIELILPDSDRLSLNALGELELNDNVTAFFEGKFVETSTRDSIQVNGFNDDILISLDNPYIPAALRAQLDSLIAEGITPEVVVSRDNLDVVPIPLAERETFRFVAGLKGPISSTFDYELSWNFGRTQADVTNGNTRLEDRFFAAVDAVTDPVSGNIVCRSSLDPTATPPVSPFPFYGGPAFGTFSPTDGTCQPINIFGPGSIAASPGADFAFVDTFESTEITQKSVVGIITGDSSNLFELPAGAVGLAAGFEWRAEESRFDPDPLAVNGFTFGSVSAGPPSPTRGEVEVFEVFGEARIPLLKDMPGAELLEVTTSARISDYDTIGTTEAWSVNGRYQPLQPVTVRASYSEAIRAPNIGELFNPQLPATIGATQDPCNPQFINAGSEFRAANCALFVAPGFNSVDFNSAFVAGVSGGNPNLVAETATTYTLGAVLDDLPGIASGFTATVDYYNIEIADAIDALSAFAIAQRCVDAPSIDNQFCSQIFRDPTDGFITGFESGQINLGALETEGIDFSFNYGFDLPSTFGRMNLNLSGTHFLEYLETTTPEDDSSFVDRLGTFALPEWIVTGTANWDYDRFGVGWTTRYESSQTLPSITNEDLDDPNFSEFTKTGDSFVHDLNLSYEFSDEIEFFGGVVNVFDRDPYFSALTRPAGPRGRFFFLGVDFDF